MLSSQKDGKIDTEELESQYVTLGYKPRKMTEYGCSEVEDVIWEVCLSDCRRNAPFFLLMDFLT